MLRISDGIPYDGFQENLEHIARFFIYKARDSLDAAATRQSAYGRLGDSLDVIAKHLAMTLRAALAETCVVQIMATEGMEFCVDVERRQS